MPDDRVLWDTWLRAYHFPALTVADEIGLFAFLEKRPATADDVAAALSLSPRASEALLGTLRALGFLERRDGRFGNTPEASAFLVPSSPTYWGGMLRFSRDVAVSHATLKDALLKDRPRDGSMDAMWKSHEMTPEAAAAFTAAMHSRSVHLAEAMARRLDFRPVRRFLDVAGGSGVFATAVAKAHPQVRCTVLELDAVAKLARDYSGGAVEVRTADMFRDPWPSGYDVHFFSNIFHDWDDGRCAALARRSIDALAPGGRIWIHEILLDDTRDGPLAAITDSLVMMLFTEGKQRSLGEFRAILEGAGFRDVTARPTSAYYTVVEGIKGQ